MVYRAMSLPYANACPGRKRGRDIVFCQPDGIGNGISAAHETGYGRRERAPRAMCVDGVYRLGGKRFDQPSVSVVKPVYLVAALNVAALDKH